MYNCEIVISLLENCRQYLVSAYSDNGFQQLYTMVPSGKTTTEMIPVVENKEHKERKSKRQWLDMCELARNVEMEVVF